MAPFEWIVKLWQRYVKQLALQLEYFSALLNLEDLSSFPTIPTNIILLFLMAFVEILTVCNEYQINYQYIYQHISINTDHLSAYNLSKILNNCSLIICFLYCFHCVWSIISLSLFFSFSFFLCNVLWCAKRDIYSKGERHKFIRLKKNHGMIFQILMISNNQKAVKVFSIAGKSQEILEISWSNSLEWKK